MPHITLVSGYLLPFFEWNLWGHLFTSIVVLVAINQPFTLWMLHSFFLNIPKDLDESAMVDGCTRFQAFRHVIIPVMWPGVITTGLFSFLLAYNDFTVTALLLSQENQTMVPKIASFLGSTFAFVLQDLTDAGVGRFERFVDNARRFRRGLFEAVLAADRQDPASEHAYFPWSIIPGTNFSHRTVDLGPVTRFTDSDSSSAEAVQSALRDIGLLALYNVALFLLAFFRFARQELAPGALL